MVNCLVNADFYLPRGIVIKKNVKLFILDNLMTLDKNLMKMFNLLGIGERAGGGIPDIYQVWADQEWNSPVVEEFYNPDRTRLSLDFRPKQAKKTSEENKRRRTEANSIAIRKYLKEHGLSKTNDIASAIELSPARTRVLL